MNIQGYEKVRAALSVADVEYDISPVPGPGDDIQFVTITFSNGLKGAAAVHEALYDSGLSCDDGARQVNDEPALIVVRANLSQIEFEDLNYWKCGTPEFFGEQPSITPDGSQYFTPGNAPC